MNPKRISKMKNTKNENSKHKTIPVFLILLIIIASGIAVYNIDSLYLSDKNSALANIPDRLLSNSQNSFLVSTIDENGKPESGKEVIITLEINNESIELFKDVTDKDGIVQPIVNIPDVNGTAKIIVKAGSETISQDVTIYDTIKLYLSTDKPIYQPSQIIHIRTLVYEGAIPVSSQKSVRLEIQTPAGDKIFRKDFIPNEFGICSYNYSLSDQLPLGNYKITATVENISTEKTVLVKRYVLPKFKIELDNIKTWYTVEEEISGAVDCEYFFGKKVNGNVSLTSRVYLGYWETINVKKGELENGIFPFNIGKVGYAVGIPINNDNGYLELNISVTDEGGHNEKESHLITISDKPIKITLLSDNNFKGANSTYYILARYPDGTPVENGVVEFKIDNLKYGVETRTDGRGISSINFLYKEQNNIKVTVSKNGLSSSEDFQIKPSKGLKAISDKSNYNIGDIANFEVFYSGSSYTKIVYYEAVSEGFIITTGRIDLSKDKGYFKLPITLDMAPLSEIRVYKIEKGMKVIKDSLIIGVKSDEDVSVEINTNKNLYKPNEDVNLQFSVKNSTSPLVSAMEVSIVDLSVYEINERFEGMEEIFFSLDEEFMTPSYQVLNYVFSENLMSIQSDNLDKVVENEINQDRTILNVGTKNIDRAEELKNEWVGSYWTILFLLCFVIGYFGALVMAIKHKIVLKKYFAKEKSIIIALTLLTVFTVIIASVLYVWSSGFISGSMNEKGLFDEDGGNNEDLIAFDDGPPENNNFREKGVLEGGNEMDAVSDSDSNSQENTFSGSESKTEKPTHVRNYFPETWYWNPTLITDEKGEAEINLISPDSITSWGVKALASTIDAQFGAGTKNITVFQDFFIEPDIPVSVVRNDRFPLKILIYNYLNESRNISVDLTNDSWFELLSPISQNVHVNANSVSSVEFTIIAKDVGENRIKVSAKNGELEDIVIRVVRVVPDGKNVEKVFNGQLENKQTEEIIFEMDKNRVPKSENAYVKLQGGMEAVTLDGAENYIQFVSGCGEQSMSTLSIDILAFDTVQKMDGTDEQIFKFETIVSQGLQHELTFLLKANNGKGRGIVWFPGDQDVHPWLTSWGLITFQDALNAGFTIDDKIITDMQNWLVSQQENDGSYKFPEWGIYETNNPILKTKKVATTSYITRALLYSGYSAQTDIIKKSMNYIKDNIKEQWEDPYTLSLSLIALEDGKGDEKMRNEIADQLIKLKIEENETISWTTGNSMISSGESQRYNRYNSRTIETTGYAIIALNKHGTHADIVKKGVNYLLKNRKGLGGFFSTQDTVVAFQALSSIGEINIKELIVKIFVNDIEINETIFTNETKDLTYFVDIREYLNSNINIKLESEGDGKIVYQVYYEEYIPWDIIGIEKPNDLVLNVTYDATNISVNDALNARCHFEYKGNERIQMVLIELKVPVGFSFSNDDFEALLNNGIIDNYEIVNREIMIYINDIEPDSSLDFDYKLIANKPIKGTIQGVNAWDMYNPDLKVETEPIEIESYMEVI